MQTDLVVIVSIDRQIAILDYIVAKSESEDDNILM